jgi:ADP-ribosylglycohydrolase
MYNCLSCIFGAFLGDSLGSHCEFSESSPSNHYSIYTDDIFKNGQVTDDSEMAMSKAFAIMDMPDINNIDQNLLFYYYGIWIFSMPLDQGITTSIALQNFRIENMPIDGANLFSDKIRKSIAVQNYKSKANGGLMRISTLIVWFYYKNKNIIRNGLSSNDPKIFLNLYLNIYKEVQKDFEITHPNKENIVSGALLFFMTLCTMNKHGGNETIQKLFILLENDLFMKNGDENLLNNLVKNTLNEVNREQFNRFEYFKNVTKNMGYYVHAFKLVLYYLSVIDKRNKNEDNIYLKIIQEICDYGGDTDTNAAIVGTVIGPLIGYLNFTKDHLFQNMVQFYYPSRILYTSSLMYFYVESLDNYFNKNIIQKESGIKFNTLKILLDMLTKNIK